MLILLHCATHTYKHEHARAMEISGRLTRIYFKTGTRNSSLRLPPCTPIKVSSHPAGPRVPTETTSFAWRILLGKVLGVGIGDGRGRRRRRGIMRRRTLASVLLHTQHKGRGRRGRKGGQVGLLLRPAWQGPRCRRRRREGKEEEERDNEAEDPGECTVAHSTQGEKKEREEGNTSRPAAPPDCAPVVQTKNKLTPLSASWKLAFGSHPEPFQHHPSPQHRKYRLLLQPTAQVLVAKASPSSPCHPEMNARTLACSHRPG